MQSDNVYAKVPRFQATPTKQTIFIPIIVFPNFPSYNALSTTNYSSEWV